jgi:glycosyltransferase involved in cell wall biosynthesis/subtilisin family serine protease
MIIGIDASRANRSHKSGTEWYSYYVIFALAELDKENEYILYTDTPLVGDLATLVSEHKNFRAKILGWPWKFFWTQGRLSLEMLFKAPDVLFVPAHALPIIHPKKSIVTIHDIGFRRDAKLYERSSIGAESSTRLSIVNALARFITFGKYGANTFDYLDWSTRYSVRHARKIIAISDFTKKELIDAYGAEADKIVVVHNGYNDKLYKDLAADPAGEAVLSLYGIRPPYLFYVGRLEKKKNIAALIEAFHFLKNRRPDLPHKLYLVGDASFGFDDIKYSIHGFGLENDIFTTGWIAEKDLPHIFARAEAFVFPSNYEGFGIPLLQAMATKTPIAASQAASIPEIAEDAAVFFNPSNPDDMANAMISVLDDKELRRRLVKAGEERVKQFSWKKCAEGILQTIKILSLVITIASLALPFNFSSAQSEAAIRPDSIIVKFKNEAAPREVAVPKNKSARELISYYSKQKNVDYAEPNYIVSAAFTPSDTYFSNQWYLQRIKATAAWDFSQAGSTIIIAVIDSGVQVYHPDLRPNMWMNPGEIPGNSRDDDRNGFVDDVYGWDFVNGFADPSPKFKLGFTEGGVIHGTVIAGIAAAAGNNREGVTGVSWHSKIMAIKALDDKGNGDIATVIKSIDYAVARGANIINLSFVGFGYSRGLEDAIKRAKQAGVIVVAPAGNEAAVTQGLNLNERPVYPACYRDAQGKKLVVGVAATDGIDQKAPFSGYGNKCIDIAAPGVSFYTTSVYAPDKSTEGRFFNQYYEGYWSGTSMAVPVISGTLALIMGANPGLAPEKALEILLRTSDNINELNPAYANQLGSGRVNTAQAVMETVLQLKKQRAHFGFARGNGPALITLTDNSGVKEKEFLAYRETYTGGVNMAAGDFDNDGNDEIVVAPAKGLEADIKIFNSQGLTLSHFLAYPYSYKGGVSVAVADLDNDGRVEIITAPNAGYEPLVKVFNKDGKLLRSFLAYPASFKGGISITVGDVRAENGKEIITAPGRGGIPQVKVFSSQGQLLNHFLAAPRNDTRGLRLSSGDLDGNPSRTFGQSHERTIFCNGL